MTDPAPPPTLAEQAAETVAVYLEPCGHPGSHTFADSEDGGVPCQECGEARILAALRQTAEERDAEWCDAMWPANPEGAEPVTPSLGAEWYREQVAAARAEGERAGRDAEREAWQRLAKDMLAVCLKRPHDGSQLDEDLEGVLLGLRARGQQ